jgi:23S rRNA G2445 N2-methylase RlmL
VVHVGKHEGYVRWRGSYADVAAAYLVLRTADRITLEMGSFHATKFAGPRHKAAKFEWKRFVGPVDRVALRVTSKRRCTTSAAPANAPPRLSPGHRQGAATRERPACRGTRA